MRLCATHLPMLSVLCTAGPPSTRRVGQTGMSGSFSDSVTLEELRQKQSDFVAERDWGKFHQPRSLALAMVGEVGEVCELLQWRSDAEAAPGLPDWSPSEKAALADELADVLSYVIRLADVADIDLSAAFLAKLEKNRAKYPAAQVRGSAKKYDAYDTYVPEGAAPSEAEGGEWGTPQWVNDAYARARAKVEAAYPETTASGTSGGGGTGAAATTAADVGNAPSNLAHPPAAGSSGMSPQQRAAARAEAQMEARRQAAAARVEEQDDSSAGGEADRGAGAGVEVDSLDELWGLMEFGDGPGMSF